MSLSEYVGEILQTQSTYSSSEISNNDSYVTKEELLSILQELRREIDREIIREVNKAEISWETSAASLLTMKSEMLKIVAGSDELKEAYSKYQKRKK